MLEVAGRIAAKTGCKLLSEWANARQERGAGRVVSTACLIRIDQALEHWHRSNHRFWWARARGRFLLAYPNKPAMHPP